MKRNALQWVFTVDSDVLVYDTVNEYFLKHILNTEYEAAICLPEQEHQKFRWASSAHTAFVSIGFLEKLCEFIIYTYKFDFGTLQKKIDFHVENGLNGGICDMTLLYLYSYEKKGQLLNLLIPLEGKVFDSNMNSGDLYYKDEFCKKGKYKNVLFKNKIPYSINYKNQMITFESLHFQGHAKKDMINYYKGRNFKNIIKIKCRNFYTKIKSKVRIISNIA